MNDFFMTAAVCAIVCVGSVPVAQAQDGDATQIAQAGFEEGAKAYLEERYEAAIVTWSKSYEIWPAAIIRYNMSLAAAKLEHFSQALAYAAEAAANKEVPLDDKYMAKLNANSLAWSSRLKSDQITRRIFQQTPAELTLDWRGYTGVGMATVGAGLVVAAIVTGAGASSDNEALSDSPSKAAYESSRSDLENKQVVGQVLLYSGAALFATGASLVVWDLFFDDSLVDVALVPGVKSAHVSVQWGF